MRMVKARESSPSSVEGFIELYTRRSDCSSFFGHKGSNKTSASASVPFEVCC